MALPTKVKYADERQAALHNKFPSDNFLGNESNVDHFIQWVTFFRRNLHRFAIDYFGIKLHLYQIFFLYLMGIKRFFVAIASRASAKSFLVALGACIYCCLYPHTQVVIASGTRKQARLMVSEKIQKELMVMSPTLKSEIKSIVNNQSETIVWFKNNSSITVVTANDNGRGYRSTVLVREEFRQISKTAEDFTLSPFQIIRQPPYILDEFYSGIVGLKEEPKDIYISSSWHDNGNIWMWKIVDQAYKEMLDGKDAMLLAFDESIALKHGIKTMKYFQTQKAKMDRASWEIEVLNTRLKENVFAYFPYTMLEQNQRCKQVFYPRTLLDFRMGKKNPYSIPKQKNERRLVSCDMAFVENEKNDNSIFSCIRLLPECTTYTRGANDITVDNGYRRIVSYLESVQGGDTMRQAVRIRQLFEDFNADYIVLDTRNAGISIYDNLAKVMYDEERGVEYAPLLCMNDDNIAARIKIEGATPCIYAINASQKLNSDIAMDFRRVLDSKKIDLLIPFEQALEEILPNIKEYVGAVEGTDQAFYEVPFLETQALITETTELVYEKKPQTGAIVIREQGDNRKDRYTSCSYGSYFSSLLEQDLLSNNDEYEYETFIN